MDNICKPINAGNYNNAGIADPKEGACTVTQDLHEYHIDARRCLTHFGEIQKRMIAVHLQDSGSRLRDFAAGLQDIFYSKLELVIKVYGDFPLLHIEDLDAIPRYSEYGHLQTEYWVKEGCIDRSMAMKAIFGSSKPPIPASDLMQDGSICLHNTKRRDNGTGKPYAWTRYEAFEADLTCCKVIAVDPDILRKRIYTYHPVLEKIALMISSKTKEVPQIEARAYVTGHRPLDSIEYCALMEIFEISNKHNCLIWPPGSYSQDLRRHIEYASRLRQAS